MHDLIRRYGVIVDWGSGTVLDDTTASFREMLHPRAVQHWDGLA